MVINDNHLHTSLRINFQQAVLPMTRRVNLTIYIFPIYPTNLSWETYFPIIKFATPPTPVFANQELQITPCLISICLFLTQYPTTPTFMHWLNLKKENLPTEILCLSVPTRDNYSTIFTKVYFGYTCTQL